MRPHRLTLAGFRSYAEAHTFDFADRRLVGVVGPIGSGKSSLLDAIAFALYGKTPTVEAGTRSLINQRKDVGRVELWFEVDGQHWRAVRALRRSGQSEHVLQRYAEPSEMSEKLETVTGARPVTEKVEGLLGLGFGAFTRSVLLAQNQFAAFLHARPGDRDAVLKGAFGFDRVDAMHALAKERHGAAKRDLEELERRRAEIEQDRVALVEAAAELDAAQAAVAGLEAAEPAMTAATGAIAAAEADRVAAARRSRALAELATALPDRRASAKLLDDAAAAAQAGLAADELLEAARAATASAEKALLSVVTDLGDRAALAGANLAVQRVADREARLAEATTRHQAAVAAATRAAKERDRAAAAAEKVEAAAAAAAATREEAAGGLAAATVELHEAQHGEMAVTLRAELAAGQPCPVCDQQVATLPRRRKAAGLTAAQKALAAAEKRLRAADAKAAEARASAEATGREMAATTERVAAGDTALAAAEEDLALRRGEYEQAVAELKSVVGKRDPLKQVGAWEERLTAAERARDQARQAEEAAAAAVEDARRDLEQRRHDLERLGRELAAIAARLDAELDVTARPDDLRAGLDRLQSLWSEAAEAATAAESDAATRRAAAEGERASLLEGLGLAADADFGEAAIAARETAAARAERVANLEARVARFAELERENAVAVARLEVYRSLAADLAPAKFLGYLLAEERSALATLGGERFELLSGGRYRFTPGGDFGIVDLFAADAERRPESLSGGETFLASLALALALAEMVTREGGRLDAFFLDEGFGSLDAEHLDLAMEGIERLVADAPNRLVVVVSHVPEMRHRLEDVIVLEKDPVTGDTIVPGPDT